MSLFLSKRAMTQATRKGQRDDDATQRSVRAGPLFRQDGPATHQGINFLCWGVVLLTHQSVFIIH